MVLEAVYDDEDENEDVNKNGKRKLRRAAGQTRLRCSAEFLLCLKSD
jgi:hypothetical protein